MLVKLELLPKEKLATANSASNLVLGCPTADIFLQATQFDIKCHAAKLGFEEAAKPHIKQGARASEENLKKVATIF